MRRLGKGKTIVLLIALVGLAACTRSLSGPAPTAEVYSQSTPIVTETTATPGAGETVIVAETATPIPTMTPTLETSAAEATPTSTTEVAATPTATTAAPSTPVAPSPSEFSFTVQTGDTLWGLAIRFGTTIEAIKTRNGLTADVIYKGQVLIIPGTQPGTGQSVTHVVQPGENLFRIALKYGTTSQAISAANGIVNPSLIYAGQELLIPTGGAPPVEGARYHVVQPGETLSGIALKYGTTPWAIATANGISNTGQIYAGQTLRIP
jgi:LysM repeat protein